MSNKASRDEDVTSEHDYEERPTPGPRRSTRKSVSDADTDPTQEDTIKKTGKRPRPIGNKTMAGFPILHVAEMWKRRDNKSIQVALAFIPFKQGK